MTIEMNSTVVCPVTDKDGEVSYQMGLLVDLNSRFATVKFSDGKTIKVGKTKIEAVENPHKRPKLDGDVKKPRGSDRRKKNHLASDIPPPKKDVSLNQISDYNYLPCKASSGRHSRDNGDAVAETLRGKSLDETYRLVAEFLDVAEDSLRAKYKHLNLGQQRMCLGNRLRGAKKGR